MAFLLELHHIIFQVVIIFPEFYYITEFNYITGNYLCYENSVTLNEFWSIILSVPTKKVNLCLTSIIVLVIDIW